jgi:hypothetical protein
MAFARVPPAASGGHAGSCMITWDTSLVRPEPQLSQRKETLTFP